MQNTTNEPEHASDAHQIRNQQSSTIARLVLPL